MEHIEKLKKCIAENFEYCNQEDTPYLCSQLSTKEGYDQMMQLVVDLVVGDAMTINDAMSQVERTFNINRLD